MKQVPKKNYFILSVLIFATIFITLSLVDVYKNRDKLTSSIYNYANRITNSEFDEYMVESSDLLIYMADKYNLTNDTFERNFAKKIDELNLKDKLIYIDKSELNKKFLDKLRKEYDINISIKDLPTIVVIINKKVIKNVYIKQNSDVEKIIEYEAFE